MLRTITRLDKFAALRRILLRKGMLDGTTSSHIGQLFSEGGCVSEHEDGEEGVSDVEEEDDEEMDGKEKPGVDKHLKDAGPVAGPQALSSIVLPEKPGTYAPPSRQLKLTEV